MTDEPRNDLDPFAVDPPPCTYAAEGKCPLVKEDARGPGHISLITLGSCAECPGHGEFDLFGGPHFPANPPRR